MTFGREWASRFIVTNFYIDGNIKEMLRGGSKKSDLVARIAANNPAKFNERKLVRSRREASSKKKVEEKGKVEKKTKDTKVKAIPTISFDVNSVIDFIGRDKLIRARDETDLLRLMGKNNNDAGVLSLGWEDYLQLLRQSAQRAGNPVIGPVYWRTSIRIARGFVSPTVLETM